MPNKRAGRVPLDTFLTFNGRGTRTGPPAFMSAKREVPSYISSTVGDGEGGWHFVLRPSDTFDAARGRALGGRKNRLLWFWPQWKFHARNRQELATMLSGLRDMGVALMWIGHGWYAGDVFELLREEGLVEGPYRAINFGAQGCNLFER